jgi:ABC-type multidrug transport system fused ATPase/permease subunit
MRARDVLASARTAFTGDSLRGAGWLASLVFAERLLTPAVAWAFFQSTETRKLAVALLLAGVFVVRTFSQQTVRARIEAGLFHRIVAALLDGDVLRANVLARDDARAELAQGVFQCAQALGREIPLLVGDVAAASVLAVVTLTIEPPRLALLAAGATFAGALALLWSRSRVQRSVARAWRAQEIVLEGFVDALEGRSEIVASGLRDAFVLESERRTRAWAAASVHVGWSALVSGRLPLLAIAAGVGGAIAANATVRQWLPLAAADVALLAGVAPAFAGVAQAVQALARSERWIIMVAEALEGPSRLARGSRRMPRERAPIELCEVSFRYDSRGPSEDVLHAVSFPCATGAALALTGPNGSGKSTCLRLILQLAQPTAGVIRVDGIDLREVDAQAWGARSAFLSQRPYLPPRSTVRTSIRLLAPGASDDRMRRALERVGLLSPLETLAPNPLDVLVDTLSAGQRQRVALARFLCRDASLFVLDEPDANLDRAGVALVAELLGELKTRGIVVFAAHAEELLRMADTVVALDGGRVAERTSRV